MMTHFNEEVRSFLVTDYIIREVVLKGVRILIPCFLPWLMLILVA